MKNLIILKELDINKVEIKQTKDYCTIVFKNELNLISGEMIITGKNTLKKIKKCFNIVLNDE